MNVTLQLHCRNCGKPMTATVDEADAEFATCLMRAVLCDSCTPIRQPDAQPTRTEPREIRMPYAD
jgi:hypothetical protein